MAKCRMSRAAIARCIIGARRVFTASQSIYLRSSCGSSSHGDFGWTCQWFLPVSDALHAITSVSGRRPATTSSKAESSATGVIRRWCSRLSQWCVRVRHARLRETATHVLRIEQTRFGTAIPRRRMGSRSRLTVSVTVHLDSWLPVVAPLGALP